NYEEDFIIILIILEYTQALLYDNESENFNLNKIEPNSYNKLLTELNNKRDIEIEDISIKILKLTLYKIDTNIVEKYYNSITNLQRLRQVTENVNNFS
ncbi:11686_t:CDS:2, partial [Scutellospora calospora]